MSRESLAENNLERSIDNIYLKEIMRINRRKKILFVCTHNSARSQMAEGLINKLYGESFEAFSAGTNPTTVNRYAVAVMREIGIDISKNRSKAIDEFQDVDFDYVITVCDDAKKNCPAFPGGKKHIHKSFRDPSSLKASDERKTVVFKQVRDQIIDWIDKTFIINGKKSLKG